jgi:hypothetical protein
VHNALYNPEAPRMDSYQRLPVDDDYDLIVGFSLFTHLAPDDTACMLRLARKAIRDDGFLFFSAFCDDSVYRFEDRVPGKPLVNAYYNRGYLQDLIKDANWALVSYEPPGSYIMDSFLCRPM